MRKVNKLDYCNYEYLWICSFSERAVNTGSVCVPSFKLQCVWGERDQSKAVVVAYRRPTLRKFAHINNRLTPNFRVAYTWKDAWDIGSSSYQSYGWHKKTVCYWVYRKTKHNILEIWYTCTVHGQIIDGATNPIYGSVTAYVAQPVVSITWQEIFALNWNNIHPFRHTELLR